MASNGLKVYDQLFPQIQDGCQISLEVKWHILTERRIEGYIQYFIGFLPLLCPAHMDRFFVVRTSEKKSEWRSNFFSDWVSANGPTFCHKQLREKIGPIFSRTKSQRTGTDFLSELLCVTIADEVSLLDDVSSISYWTEVSAHGPIFCRKQLREKIGAILYRSKSRRTWTDFHTDFLSTIKNRSVCAGH